MPRWVLDLLACWKGQLGRHLNVCIWNAILLCFLWCIWRERNAQSFRDWEKSVLDLKLGCCWRPNMIGWLLMRIFPSLTYMIFLIFLVFFIFFIGKLHTQWVLHPWPHPPSHYCGRRKCQLSYNLAAFLEFFGTFFVYLLFTCPPPPIYAFSMRLIAYQISNNVLPVPFGLNGTFTNHEERVVCEVTSWSPIMRVYTKRKKK